MSRPGEVVEAAEAVAAIEGAVSAAIVAVAVGAPMPGSPTMEGMAPRSVTSVTRGSSTGMEMTALEAAGGAVGTAMDTVAAEGDAVLVVATAEDISAGTTIIQALARLQQLLGRRMLMIKLPSLVLVKWSFGVRLRILRCPCVCYDACLCRLFVARICVGQDYRLLLLAPMVSSLVCVESVLCTDFPTCLLLFVSALLGQFAVLLRIPRGVNAFSLIGVVFLCEDLARRVSSPAPLQPYLCVALLVSRCLALPSSYLDSIEWWHSLAYRAVRRDFPPPRNHGMSRA